VLSAVMHEAATITPRERRPRIPACDGPGLLFRLKLPLLPASFCLTLTTGNRTFSRRVESGNPESGIPRHRQCFSTELDWQFAPIFGNFRGSRAVCPPRLASVGQTRRSATRRRRPALPATHVPILLEVEGEIARETMSIEAVKDVAPQQFEIASHTDLLTDPRNNREGRCLVWLGVYTLAFHFRML
jgi:hypothetical protein